MNWRKRWWNETTWPISIFVHHGRPVLQIKTFKPGVPKCAPRLKFSKIMQGYNLKSVVFGNSEQQLNNTWWNIYKYKYLQLIIFKLGFSKIKNWYFHDCFSILLFFMEIYFINKHRQFGNISNIFVRCCYSS